MSSPFQIPGLPEGVVLELHIRLHSNGAMSISGPTGDQKLMLFLIDNARDAVNNQFGVNRPKIIVPAKDVEVRASTPSDPVAP